MQMAKKKKAAHCCVAFNEPGALISLEVDQTTDSDVLEIFDVRGIIPGAVRRLRVVSGEMAVFDPNRHRSGVNLLYDTEAEHFHFFLVEREGVLPVLELTKTSVIATAVPCYAADFKDVSFARDVLVLTVKNGGTEMVPFRA